MRIVGGKYKSRVLLEFKGNAVRPTPDKVRESFFNIIQSRVYGCSFLDLCSGTGAMGIEALSRGAKYVAFNDFDRQSVKLTTQNLEKLGIDSGVKVTNLDACVFLKSTAEKFDVIYIDLPYINDKAQSVLELCLDRLNENGIVVYENEKPFDLSVSNLVQFDQRKYGRVYLTFFKEK